MQHGCSFLIALLPKYAPALAHCVSHYQFIPPAPLHTRTHPRTHTHGRTHMRTQMRTQNKAVNLPAGAARIETPKKGLCCVWTECRCTCFQHIILCPSSSPFCLPPPPPPTPTPPCFILSISLQNFLSHVLNPFQPQLGSSLLRSPLPFAFGLTLRTDALPRSAGEAGVTLRFSSMPLSRGDKAPLEDRQWVREEDGYTLHHWQHPVGERRSQIRPPCNLFAAVSLSGNSYPSCAGRSNCLLSDT